MDAEYTDAQPLGPPCVRSEFDRQRVLVLLARHGARTRRQQM